MSPGSLIIRPARPDDASLVLAFVRELAEYEKLLDEVTATVEDIAVHGAYGETGFRNFTNSKRPIKTPDDIKGLKLRVMTVPLFVEMVKALGGQPTPISWPWAGGSPAISSPATGRAAAPGRSWSGPRAATGRR